MGDAAVPALNTSAEPKPKPKEPASQQTARSSNAARESTKQHCKCTCEHGRMLRMRLQAPGHLTRRGCTDGPSTWHDDDEREPPRARAISTINQHPPVSPALLKANATFTRRRRQQDADGCEPCGRWLDTLSRQHRQLSARLAHSEELPFLRCERPSWNAASPRLTAPTEPFNLQIPRQHKDWKTKARQYVTP